jgi:hypothetical protein
MFRHRPPTLSALLQKIAAALAELFGATAGA